jgi:hypothetical protein
MVQPTARSYAGQSGSRAIPPEGERHEFEALCQASFERRSSFDESVRKRGSASAGNRAASTCLRMRCASTLYSSAFKARFQVQLEFQTTAKLGSTRLKNFDRRSRWPNIETAALTFSKYIRTGILRCASAASIFVRLSFRPRGGASCPSGLRRPLGQHA